MPLRQTRPMDTESFAASELLEHQQLRLLYGAVPNSLLANLFGCIVAILVFTSVVEAWRLYTWVGLLVPVTLLRHWHYRQYRRARPGPEENQYWYVRFRIGSVLLAFAIGSAGFLLFVYDNSNYQMLLALLIVCIGSFATTTLAPHRPIVVVFLLILFFPIVGTMFLLATDVTRYIALVLILLVFMLISSAMGVSGTVNQSIRLGIEAAYREERLRDVKQRLDMFVQETPLAVIEWNLERQIIGWNPAAERIFAYGPEEARSLSALELVYDNRQKSLPETLDEAFQDSGQFHSIQENRRKDGMLVLCEWINTPLIDAGGQVVGVLSLVQDITQRVATERIKNEFISIVSHELRTPVTAIKGGLGLLASGVLDDDQEQSRALLDVAMANTNRLHLLINDILDVDKLESGKMEFRFSAYSLASLLRDVIAANEPYAAQHGVRIAPPEIDPEVADSSVYCDPDRVFQVLTNLLSNAIKFSDKGAAVQLAASLQGERCRIAVTNHGEVIPEADREHMFGKFFQRDSSTTRSKGGTGLGLYICQKILAEHGTHLDFVSGETSGTCFFFDLQRVEDGKEPLTSAGS